MRYLWRFVSLVVLPFIALFELGVVPAQADPADFQSEVAALAATPDAEWVTQQLTTILSSQQATQLFPQSAVGPTLTRPTEDNTTYVVSPAAAAAYASQIASALRSSVSGLPVTGNAAVDALAAQLNAVLESPQWADASTSLASLMTSPDATTNFSQKLTTLIDQGVMIPADLTNLLDASAVPMSRLTFAFGFNIFGVLSGVVATATAAAGLVCLAFAPCAGSALAVGLIAGIGGLGAGVLGTIAVFYDQTSSPQKCHAAAGQPVFQGGGKVYFSGYASCQYTAANLDVYIAEVDNGKEAAYTGTSCSNCTQTPTAAIQTYSMPAGCYQTDAYFEEYDSSQTTTGQTVYSQDTCGQP